MDALSLEQVTSIAYALAIGFIVGLEREHSVLVPDEPRDPQVPPPSGIVGVRTFTLLSLLGWVSAWLSGALVWIFPAMLLVIGLVLAARHARAAEAGLTTEIAAITTFSLGFVAAQDRVLGVALALVTTLLLVAKPYTRAFVTKLRRVEITGTLQLLALFAVVLPLLPEAPPDPWEALPPRKIGWFVALVASISYIGYAFTRILGARRSAGLTGIVGGLASSTAVTAAMAADARRDESMIAPGQLATFLANTVMCVRVLVVTAIVAKPVAVALARPLAAMAILLLLAAGERWAHVRRQAEPGGVLARVPEIGNPFAILPAMRWGALLCGVLLVAEIAETTLGSRGLLFAAAASGIADVDAITLAVARQASEGTLGQSMAALTVTVAVTSNAVVKSGIALVAGGLRFGRLVAAVLILSTAAGVVVAALG